ncbi:MAG TPA: hypothetical protein VNZ52_15545 [Candidatus Thermoplasmatota archaeon]|nr:hypothetical protein [Candidatus Thermoplasmatota archaeon]
MAAPLLAGCIGGDEAPPAPQVNTNNNTEGNLTVDGDVKSQDGRDLAAFQETNRTEMGRGGMEHLHDYWEGKTTYTVMQGDWWFIPLPLQPDGNSKYPTGTAIADLSPDIGRLVPEGTSKLEITVKIYGPTPQICSIRGNQLPACIVSPVGHPLAEGLGLEYVTANDNLGEWRDGGQLLNGVPTFIDLKPNEADMPHSTASLWLFRLYTLEANSVGFNITVVAHKGYDVVNWPGHPDFYVEKPFRVVFDNTVDMSYSGWHTFNLYGDDSTWVTPEKLISWGTTRLEVYVNISEASLNPEYSFVQLKGWHLDAHNATNQPRIATTDITMDEYYDENTDGKNYHFTIPLDDAAYDSPYASVSRWGFRMLPDYEGALENGCIEMCPGFKMKASYTIIAWNDDKLKGAAAPANPEA